MNAALRMDQVTKSFHSPSGECLPVLDVPEFHVTQGDMIAIMGESGLGKTTLLHVIAGIVRPDRGSVVISGTDVTHLREGDLDTFRAKHIGYVFQSFNLLQGFTALENVEIAMRFAGHVDRARARDLLAKVGLSERMNFLPRALSWGQQQRVAIARAMANKPALVLADEPTGSLDAVKSREVMDLILTFCREVGATLILVTHDPVVSAMVPRQTSLHQINRVGQGVGTPA